MFNTGTDYVLVQGPDGLPMAVPVYGKSNGSTLSGSFTESQKGHPQMVPIPYFGDVGQPHTGSDGWDAGQLRTLEVQSLNPQIMTMPNSGGVAAGTSEGMVAGYPPQQNLMRWSYLEGQNQ